MKDTHILLISISQERYELIQQAIDKLDLEDKTFERFISDAAEFMAGRVLEDD